jgi:membrane-bound ClpP family serine protease
MIPWIIIAVGVLLLFSSLKEGAKAWPSAAGAIVIGIGVVALGKSFGWLAIGAGVLGLMFLLISLKAVTRLLAGAALIGMVLGGVLSIDLDDDDDTEAVADDNTATTTTTTAPDSNCEPG